MQKFSRNEISNVALFTKQYILWSKTKTVRYIEYINLRGTIRSEKVLIPMALI